MAEVMTFDEILQDKEYQSEFDRRVTKALDTAKEKWETEAGGLKQQLKDANKAIADFKGLDVDGIQKAADDWKAKFEQSEKEYAARIADMEYDSTLKDALSAYKFTSDYAKQGVHAEVKSKGLKLDNGAIMGLDDAIKAIKESKPDAFAPEEEDKPKPPHGAVYAGRVGGNPAPLPTEKEAMLAAAKAAMKIK